MATTPFSSLYERVRTLLGDLDTAFPSYSNAQLDLGIRTGLDQDATFSEDVVPTEITPEVLNKTDFFRLAVRGALALLAPSGGSFSYRTPMLSVARGGNDARSNLARLEDLLKRLVDGDLTLDADTDWDQLFDGLNRVEEKLSKLSVSQLNP